MNFITRMGKKAMAAAASVVEEKPVNEKDVKENAVKDKKKQGATKAIEKVEKNQKAPKNDKKTTPSTGGEGAANVQLNGSVSKKEKEVDGKKNNNAKENNASGASSNKAEQNQNATKKKKKVNKNNKKEDGPAGNINEESMEEEKMNENPAQGKAKGAKKTDGKKVDGKKVDGKKADEKKTDEKKADAKKTDAKKTEVVKAEVAKTEVAKADVVKEEAKKDMKKELKLKDDERKKIENDLNKKFLKLSKQDNNKNINEKMEAEVKRKSEYENLIASINTSIAKINAQTPRPTNMKMSSADVENKCKEAKLKKKKINPKNEEEMEEVNTYINYLEEQLNITKNYENFKNFQNRLITLKKSCEEKLKENVKSMSEIKDQEKKLRFVDKIIKFKKEKHNVTIVEADITNKEFIMASDKYNQLIKPFNFINKIQNKYVVYVDKVNNNNFENKVSLFISGCQEDIENFITHIKNLDLTEKNYVYMPNRIFKSMLNMHEGSFKKMEEETNVLLHIDNDTLYYCGMKSDIEKLKEIIEKASTEQSTNAKNISKDIKLDSVLGRGFNKSLLKAIEVKTNTFIRMNYDPKSFEAWATIKGNKTADIEEAEEKLNEIIKGLESKFIEFDEREMFNLYKKCAYELNDIKMNLNLFVVRQDNGISLVGKGENIQKGLEILDYVKNVISSKSVKKKVTEEEAYLFNANYRNYIKTQTGAEVKIFNKTNYKELNISGNKNDIDNALKLIDELLEKRKCVHVEITEKVIAMLLSSKAQKIKEIEKDTSTSIQINKNNHVAQIYGHEENIALAKEVLQNLLQSSDDKEEKQTTNNNYITVEMVVDTEYIGSIIGKKGRTINKIQEETFAKKIHIDKDSKKVLIQGTPKTVEAAQKEILKILNRSKEENGQYNNYQNDRYKNSNHSLTPNRRSTYHSSSNNTRSTNNKSSYRPESAKNGVYINTNDEKAFPSLHDVSNIQSRKTKKAINQANVKKQDEEQHAAEAMVADKQ
ncbi:PRE-binding protein, putative [Plasmodium knowlesi strain H]|uniref:PRE-binding protein, putative n=3 Tax=Plasmodium knowlesi TaxID=5850 RepID=A0A5K1TYY5_PLAKH|nr:PRE-binding protein, putative [Plasmodium knowlesi strain H]OTN65745.1 putative PRE-binding protein [Plasmodium knowlesi]CAA9987759.1 PRE-binding protein, putative [Plasmodium knowlesi strain H]SBO27084.1 PRE-binding protein, putative [Plasmodium knowlesi strain H]SBO29438.1 PRE-binding protein, putative [Plasmodium knowlesi strain H]VVS77233.1 PRE-binding protein, putative [Plasmodium knowlesi strain H]|eukprot:XP_002258756.1 qf122 antigen, putative [Plasmodium knowlesi strain H]